jgi:hypothetical protein
LDGCEGRAMRCNLVASDDETSSSEIRQVESSRFSRKVYDLAGGFFELRQRP